MSLRTEDDTKACEDALYAVVAAELNNWVPGASQRLIRRAADSLRLVAGIGYEDVEECPDDRHCRIYDWVAGHFVLRCIICDNMF